MYKLVLLFVLAAVTANGEPEGAGRFLAATRTSTVVVLSTTTVPTVVKKTCWTAAAVLTMCRRRRGVEEQPDIINSEAPFEKITPSQTVPLQTTALPNFEEPKVFQVGDKLKTELEPSTEVEVSGGMQNCLGRSAFGITIFFTTSTTVVLTSFSTSTSGATTFTLGQCFPSVLEKDKC